MLSFKAFESDQKIHTIIKSNQEGKRNSNQSYPTYPIRMNTIGCLKHVQHLTNASHKFYSNYRIQYILIDEPADVNNLRDWPINQSR